MKRLLGPDTKFLAYICGFFVTWSRKEQPSYIFSYIYTFFRLIFHYGLLQDNEYSSCAIQ